MIGLDRTECFIKRAWDILNIARSTGGKSYSFLSIGLPRAGKQRR
jgi:hypothetical protein